MLQLNLGNQTYMFCGHQDQILIFVLAFLSNFLQLDGAILQARFECGFVFGKQDLKNHFRYKIISNW